MLHARPRSRGACALVLGASIVVLATFAASAGVASSAGTRDFSLKATTTCLHAHGGVVGRVQPTNRRLRALRDLAQKTSRQVRVKGAVVGMAFSRSVADAELLYELLQVPKDPLLLERRRNVVLLSPRRAPAARSVAVACLRA